MKKLNIAVLTVLLVFQTLLSPLATYANEPDATKPEISEQPDGGNDVGGGDVVEEPGNDGAMEDEGESKPTLPPTDDNESMEDGKESVEKNPDNELTGGGEDKALPSEGTAESIQEDVILNFVSLFTGGQTITNASEAASVTPTIGQEVDVNYEFEINAKKDYGVGSTFSFDLPNALLNFNQGGLDGKVTLEGGGIEFDYKTIGSTVTLTLTTGTIEDGNILENGKLKFSALFSEVGAKDGFDQELDIPVIGGDTVKLPFKFKPKVDSSKTPLAKSGAARTTNGERFIDWVVWVNESGQLLNNATIEDALGKGHELVNDVTIERYPFTFTGLSTTFDKTETSKNLSNIELDDGYYAYKLTYSTKVTRVATEVEELFENKVTFKNNGSTVDTKDISVNHVYGTKLSKEALGTDKYGVKWEIKYNYFGSKFDTKEITDTVSGPHIIKEETVKVYHVTVDATGKGTKGVEYTPQPKPYLSTDKKTLKINLPSPNGEAYIIEYETELNDEFYTGQDGSRVENKVSYDNESDKEGFNITENIFHKTGGENSTSIDYDKKEITWTLTINAEKAMKDVVITDTFEEIDGKTRQKLIENSFTGLPSGVTPKIVKDIDGYIESFVLNLDKLPEGKHIITYKTNFDIDANGATYGVYKNTAKLDWKSTDPSNMKSYSLEKSAQYDPGTSPTGRNGYKEGTFDHVNQKFNWYLAVNINKQDIEGAVLTDTIGDGHKLVLDSVKVYKLDLTQGEKGKKGDELKTGRDINETEKGFTVTFNKPTTDAYIVEYQTEDVDDIIGYSGGDTYDNTAKFVTINNKEFEFEAKATVQHANKLISKDVPIQNTNEETITWTVKVNESHSTIGNPIKLTDKMSSNQMILKDTFEVREIKMDANGKHSYGNWTGATPIFNDLENSFTIDLDLNQKGWEVRYTTFFTGGPDDVFSNEASISYAGATTGVDSDAKQENIKFSFNDSEGSISAKKGDLKIKKIGYNPVTGERKNLDGVEFILYNRAGTVELQRGKTNKEGIVEFYQVRYGYYKLEEIAVSGYKQIDAQEIRIADTTNFNENGGKYHEVINLADVPAPKCTIFKIEVKDIDDNLIKDGIVTLKNTITGEKTSHPVDTSGIVTLPENFPAGDYKVTHSTEGELNSVNVKYDDVDCNAKVQPNPSCEQFTVVIKDKNGDNRTDISKITLKQGNLVVAETTVNATGKFEFDSNVKDPANGLKPGNYDVYDNQQFLGTVKVTYKVVCGTELEVDYAPTCPKFTLTVKDVDGKHLENFDVKIKSEDRADASDVKIGKTSNAGEVEFTDLEPGRYYVYDNDGNRLGEFTSKSDCKAEVQPLPACPKFEIEVPGFDSNKSTGKLAIKKDSDESVSFEVSQGSNEKFEYDPKVNRIPAGKYKVYDGKLYLGTIDISYDKNNCEATVNIDANGPSCPQFILTINNAYGQARQNVKVTLTDAAGKVVEDVDGNKEFTTDANGQILIENNFIKQGKYTVKENGVTIGKITVGNTCEAKVQPNPPVDPGPGEPTDPNPEDPNKPNPEDPNKPNPEDPNKPKPEEPNKPKPEEPNKPKPEEPNKPKPEEPNKPKPEEPNKPKPEDPNKPKPEDPNKPKPEDPSNPTNPGTTPPPTLPGLEEVIKPIPPSIIPTPKDPLTPGDLAELIEEYSKDPSKLDDVVKGLKDLLDYYDSLTPEQKTEFERLYDVNGLKMLLDELEKVASLQKKLPQTDGASQFGTMLVGSALLLAGAWLFVTRRRKA
ncbi:hypothetical protein CSE16_02200 [Solibacillus sp. R5-41]|uniref:LPXTG cell wall anchor domain-containing protein n=1 Tax=Solibacillus sp. R5-41 TaxID=2048654 RepID=UPI000C125775|nr:LPXTG cell wall anchor domain-containing protein [Solibacillus sp. R5-41]ATP38926.1 hypothetical protein CSE16_02200 [Solibacillus sp. R5-41]